VDEQDTHIPEETNPFCNAIIAAPASMLCKRAIA